MGIGAIPNAVLNALGNHQEVGVHTEMFSDGLIPLIEKGVVTNQHKKKTPRKDCELLCPGKSKAL